ncbi:hypothetical protein Q7P37_006902 [Cladosporium fusiforme]
MTTFLSNLWTSVFTAGPTPTLLLATNLTFGSLQLVLLLLLLGTRSLHFLALSIISGGLWWAINWFAGEVAAVRAEEEEKKKEEEKERMRREVQEGEEDEGERTEVEVVSAREGREGGSSRRRKVGEEGGVDLSGEVSTDSEWEKVEGGR